MEILGHINMNPRPKGFTGNLDVLRKERDKTKLAHYRASRSHLKANHGVKANFNFTTYPGLHSGANIDGLLEQAIRVDDIVSNGGDIYVFDLETLGSYGSDATLAEQELFGITEVAFQKKTFSMVNGAMAEGALEDAGSLLFGIHPTRAGAYTNLLQRAKHLPWDQLTKAEKSTIQRLTAYSGEFGSVFNTLGATDKGVPLAYSLKSLTAADPTDLSAAESGLRNLLQVGRVQGYGDAKSVRQLTNLRNTLEGIANNPRAQLAHFNGSVFDEPLFNHALQTNGISPVGFNNSYDLLAQHAAASNGQLLNLSAMAEANGVAVTAAHQATADTQVTIDTMLSKANGQGEGLYKRILNQLQGIKSNPYNMTINTGNMGSTVIHANQSVKINLTSFDYVMNKAGEIVDYKDWSLNRGNFYNVLDYSFVPKAQLPKHMTDLMSPNAEGLYVMQFGNAASQLKGEVAVLARESQADFQRLFQNNLSVHALIKSNEAVNPIGSNIRTVTQKMIDSQTALSITDRARRQFDSMFQANAHNGGFDFTDNLYGAYEDLDRDVKTAFGDDFKLTQKRVHTLITKGKITHKGAEFKLGNSLSKLNNAGGFAVPERLQNFEELFNIIRDTHQTMRTSLNVIKSNITEGSFPLLRDSAILPDTVHAQRTLALQRTWNTLNMGFDNKVAAPRTFADIHTAELLSGSGDYFRINASSAEEASGRIYGRIRGIGKGEKAHRAFRKQMAELTTMAEDLHARGIITSAVISSMKGQKSAYQASQTLGSAIAGVVNDAKNTFGTAGLIDIGTLGDGDIARKYAGLIKNPLQVLNTKSYRPKGRRSLDKLVSSVESIAKGAVNETTPMFQLSKNSDLQEFKNWLHDDLHYSNSNIKSTVEALTNEKYGMIGGTHNYSVSFFKAANKHGEMVPYRAITTPDKALEVAKAISMGMNPTDLENIAVVTEMALVNEGLGTRTIKVGNTEKVIQQALSIFSRSPEDVVSEHFGSTLTVDRTDLVDESIGGYKKMHKRLQRLIKQGRFKDASRMLHNTERSPIYSASSLNGLQTFLEDGRLTKKVIPTISDVVANRTVYVGELINFLPMLYDNPGEYREIASDIDKYFRMGKDKNARRMMNTWMKQITGAKSGEYGNLIGFSTVGEEGREWFMKNLLDGHNLLEKIASNRAIIPERTAKALDDILADNPSLVIKDKYVQEGILALKGSTVQYNAYGFMSGIKKPTQFQNLNQRSIFLNEFYGSEDAAKRLARVSPYATIGETVRTHEMVRDYLNPVRQAGNNVETGITLEARRMNSEQIHDAFSITASREAEILAKLESQGHSYTPEQFKRLLNHYRTISGTNEQQSIIQPDIKQDIYGKPELMTFKVNETMEHDLAVGQQIAKGQRVGIQRFGDGTTKNVVYDKGNGVITDIRNGTVYIAPENQRISAVKLNFGNLKSVAMGAQVNDGEEALARAIFGETFGNTTGVVHNFEAGKAMAGTMLAGHYPNAIARQIGQIGDSTERAAAEGRFLNFMNAHPVLKTWGAQFQTDSVTGNRFLAINGNPSAIDGHEAAIKDLVDYYKASANTVDRGIYGELERMSASDSHVVFAHAVPMTESHSAQGAADELGKGYKYISKAKQVFNLKPGLNPGDFMTWNDGVYQSITQEISKSRDAFIQGTDDFKKGMTQLGNIRATILASMGQEHGAVIEDIKLGDLKVPGGGVTAADLEGTVFSNLAKTKDGLKVNAYRIDLGNLTLPDINNLGNPEARVKWAYVPQLVPQLYEDKAYLSETQKKLADFMSKLKQLQEGDIDPDMTIDDFKKSVDQAYVNTFKGYEFEFNDKKGLMNSKLMEGRLPFSSQAMAAKVMAPIMEDGAGKRYHTLEEIKAAAAEGTQLHLLGHEYAGKGVAEVVGGKLRLNNIVETSAQTLEEIGGKFFFNDLGFQLINDRNSFRGNAAFQKMMVNEGIINESGRIATNIDRSAFGPGKAGRKAYMRELKQAEEVAYSKLGKRWMQEVGVRGTFARSPEFFGQSQIGALIRYNPNVIGQEAVIPHHMMINVNGDVDGDKVNFILELRRDKKRGRRRRPRTRMLDVNDPIERAHVELYETASQTNAEMTLGDAIDNYTSEPDKLGQRAGMAPGEELGIVKRAVEKDLKPGTGDNLLRNVLARVDAVKTKFTMTAISDVSAPSNVLRDITTTVWGGSISGRQRIQDVEEFTHQTEQKGISVKLATSSVDEVSHGPAYRRALKHMANGEFEEGLSGLRGVMYGAGIFTKPNDFIPTEENLAVATEMLMKGKADMSRPEEVALDTIYKTFQDPRAAEIYYHSLEKSQGGQPINKIIKGLKEALLGTQSESDISGGKRAFLDKAGDTNRVISWGEGPLRAGDKIAPNLNAKGNLIPEMYSYSGMEMDNVTKQVYASFHDNYGEEHRIYGNTYNQVAGEIESRFSPVKSIDETVELYKNQIIANALKDPASFRNAAQRSAYRHSLLNLDGDDTIGLETRAGAEAHSSFFNTEHGKAMEEFLPVAETMEERFKRSPSGELIREFNERIRQRGTSKARDVMEEMIMEQAPAAHSGRQAVINDILGRASRRGVSSEATADIGGAIDSIRGTKVYNMNQVGEALGSNFTEKARDLDPALIAKYGKANALEIAERSMVTDPLASVAAENATGIKALQGHFETLANNLDNADAQAFLDWRGIANGNAKIAFGEHVGASINELSMNALREIQGHQITGEMSQAQINAVRGTQEQIGLYFDQLSRSGVNPDRATNISSREVYKVDRLTSINEAIRQAGAEAQQARTTTGAISQIAEAWETGGVGKKSVMGLAAAGIALGLASVVAGAQHTAPPSALTPERKPRGNGSPDVNGNYDSEPQVTPRKVAPPSDRSVRLQGGTGVNYNISGRANGNTDLSSVINSIQNTIQRYTGPSLQVNVNTQDDTSKVSNSWLQDRVSRLLR